MEKLNKEEVIKKLHEVLGETFSQLQEREHQFVVAYFEVSDDSLIGYHASTFCQLTQDILRAKRYAAENPYPQLEIIAKNLKYALDREHSEEEFLGKLHMVIQDDFGNLKSHEVYMDAIYLAPGTPKQDFKFTIIDTNEKDI